MINGEEAHRIGLVNHLVEPDELNSKTMEIAHNLASNLRIPSEWQRLLFELRLNTHSVQEFLQRDLFCALFDTEDMAIGVKAFLNRDKAEWTGA